MPLAHQRRPIARVGEHVPRRELTLARTVLTMGLVEHHADAIEAALGTQGVAPSLANRSRWGVAMLPPKQLASP